MARTKRRTILSKIESTHGTDPVPVAGTDAMLVNELSIEPLPAEYVNRNLLKAERGMDAEPVVGEHVRATFKIEAAGGGAAGTAPPFGAVLRACGLAETIDAGVDVEYNPISASDESCTHYINQDGTRHKMTGVRGNVEFRLARRQIPVFALDQIGLYNAAAAQELPSATLTGFQTPLPANTTNTPTFTLHGFAGVLSEVNLNLNNDTRLRDYVGADTIEIIDRAPAGSITIEAPALGTKDFFAIVKAGIIGALQIIHGTAVGNKLTVDAPAVQLMNPRYVDLDGGMGLQMDLGIQRTSAGDDEIKFTFK